jgi:hypothetical protein
MASSAKWWLIVHVLAIWQHADLPLLTVWLLQTIFDRLKYFPGSISIKSYKAKKLLPKEIISILLFFPHLVLVCDTVLNTDNLSVLTRTTTHPL